MHILLHNKISRFVLAMLVLALIVFVAILKINGATTDNWLEVFQSIDWSIVVSRFFKLSFGLAIFMFGMELLEESLRIIAGDRMKLWLKRFTVNRFAGMLTGCTVTAIIQSSSVTTVILVGFVSAELMTFARAIPVLIGANIGTTFTAQLLAFKVSHIAPYLGTIGFLFFFLYKKDKDNEKMKGLGLVLWGLALIFYGMSYMSEAMHPLRENQEFKDLMMKMDNPMLGILVAAGFTAIVQSSSATMAMIVSLASGGFITIGAGIALAFGANVGTCVTAILAAIGKSRPAIRVAAAHVIFNIIGAAFFVWFIPQLSQVVELTSDEVPRQVANAHTIFNVLVAFLFLPLTRHLANLTVKMFPDKAVEAELVMKPRYLASQRDMEETFGSTLALEGVHKEVCRVGAMVDEMYRLALPAMLHGTEQDLQKIMGMGEDVKLLHRAIIKNTFLLGQRHDGERIDGLRECERALKTITGEIRTFVRKGHERINEEIVISEGVQEAFAELHGRIGEHLSSVLQIIKGSEDTVSKEVAQKLKAKAKKVHRRKARESIASLSEKMLNDIMKRRIRLGAATRTEAYDFEESLIYHFRDLHRLLYKTAKTGLPHIVTEQDVKSEE